MEEQKEQIKDPADTAEASINRIPVVEEQPPEPARRKKTGGEENRFGKKPKIAVTAVAAIFPTLPLTIIIFISVP